MPKYSVENALNTYKYIIYEVDSWQETLNEIGTDKSHLTKIDYRKEVERRRLSRLYAEVKDNIAKRSNLDYITSPLLTNKEDNLLQDIENRFINVHGIKKEDLGEMYTFGKREPVKDTFNVKRELVPRAPDSHEFYNMPLDEDEFFAKYGENAQEKWDNPTTYEELGDRFGEEFFYLFKDEIKERYGEDILDNYEDAQADIQEEIERERENKQDIDELVKKFTERYKTNDENKDKEIDKENLIKEENLLEDDNNEIILNKENLIKEENKTDVIKENDDSLEDDEYSLDESEIPDDNNNDIEIKENTHSTVSEDSEIADDEWAVYNYDQFKRVLYQKQVVGQKKMFSRGNTPDRIDLIENQGKTYGEIFDEYEKEKQKANPDFKIDDNKNDITSLIYETQTADYKKGVIKDDDEVRLAKCSEYIANIKDQHEEHGIGYILLHPINYFTEWNVLRKMNKELKAVGFTQTEIDNKVTECRNNNNIAINSENNNIDKSISDIETVKTNEMKLENNILTQEDLTNSLANSTLENNNIITTNKVERKDIDINLDLNNKKDDIKNSTLNKTA